MSLFHILLVALIQGITEFLPISSSGHLVLLPTLTSLPDQGHLIDVAVHAGTLLAVMLYFWRDVRGLALVPVALIGIRPAQNFLDQSQHASGTEYRKLFWALVIGTLPVVIMGTVLVKTGLIDLIRTAEVIAFTSIVFGLLLWFADRKPASKSLDKVGIKAALLIGLAQVIALIPGTSRSGITMTAARFLDFDRATAARFSMLLSIPTLLAAGVLGAYEITQQDDSFIMRDALVAAGLAFIFALMAIHFLMRWLATRSMTIFVVYRVLLGLLLLGLIAFDFL